LLSEVAEAAAPGPDALVGLPVPIGTDALDPVSAYLAANSRDLLEAESLFRQQHRRALLLANARWLLFGGDIWPALSENSTVANRALQFALATSNAPLGFAVMALGRLGSSEFDVLSDADLLFVADESSAAQECRRTAERIVEFLTSYTRDGSLFPVDVRLRPMGREGDLVTTPTQLARYMAQSAQPWEAITYLRLRLVAGHAETAGRALQTVRDGISTCARQPGFAEELRVTRDRLEASDRHPNLKTGAGGTYDIDYLAGHLQALHGLWCTGNLAERIALLSRYGLIDSDDASALAEAAAFLRRLEHCIRLVTGRSGKWLPAGEHARAVVAKLMDRPERVPAGPSLDERLLAALAEVRRICRK